MEVIMTINDFKMNAQHTHIQYIEGGEVFEMNLSSRMVMDRLIELNYITSVTDFEFVPDQMDWDELVWLIPEFEDEFEIQNEM